MNVEDSNKLNRIAGAFIGLADDDEAVARFRQVDTDDPETLEDLIEEFIVPDYVASGDEERVAGMAVLNWLAMQPRQDQERYWDGDLPPFRYPESVNLYALIHKVLQRN
jgi:hypothetical protein